MRLFNGFVARVTPRCYLNNVEKGVKTAVLKTLLFVNSSRQGGYFRFCLSSCGLRFVYATARAHAFVEAPRSFRSVGHTVHECLLFFRITGPR